MSGKAAGERRGFPQRPEEEPGVCSIGAGICLHRGDAVRDRKLSYKPTTAEKWIIP